MKVLDPGHRYEVTTYDGDHTPNQIITFMKRVGPNYPFNTSEYPGTNCQEIIRVLINRVEYLNKQKPHDNNRKVILFLEQSLWLFEDRAAEQHGIEGFDIIPANIELEQTCDICGHIVCRGHK